MANIESLPTEELKVLRQEALEAEEPRLVTHVELEIGRRVLSDMGFYDASQDEVNNPPEAEQRWYF